MFLVTGLIEAEFYYHLDTELLFLAIFQKSLRQIQYPLSDTLYTSWKKKPNQWLKVGAQGYLMQ